MILVDAIYINNSGGKILLDYLVEELEKTELKVFYLLDERVFDHIPKIKDSNCSVFLKSSLIKRRKFYFEKGALFDKVLCFGNLPPNVKLSAIVYTYLHQTLYIDFPDQISLSLRLSFYLKRFIWNLFLSNTDYLIVQTNLLKDRIIQQKKMINKKILVLPFFKSLNQSLDRKLEIIKEHLSYVYISNGHSYKNHKILIEAFCKFYESNKKGKLILTITNEFSELLDLIESKQGLGFPIVNIGYVDQVSLIEVYRKSEFLIYPSLTESFGLGIVEGIEFQCKVLGADLPYLHEVCIPSLTFDPNDVDSIYRTFVHSSSVELPLSQSRVNNNILEIIKLLR